MAIIDEAVAHLKSQMSAAYQTRNPSVTVNLSLLATALGTLDRTRTAEHELKLLRRYLTDLPQELTYKSLQEGYDDYSPV